MKIISLIILFCAQPLCAKSSDAESLFGKWQAKGYIYQGTLIEPDDPQLRLTYDFLSDGTSVLFWQTKGDKSFCERKGKWVVQDQMLVEEVVWTNPENGMDCSSDPDMQIGKINISPFWVESFQLFIEIPLANEVLIYVWDSVAP